MDRFRVAFSADFLDQNRKLIFPDIGLSLFDDAPHVEYEFLADYLPEYRADQLDGFDALISLHPRVTRSSVEGNARLAAIGRCGVGCDNVDLVACTENDIVVYVARDAVRRPMAESEVLLILALSHNLLPRDQMLRCGQWERGQRLLGREPRDRIVGTIGLGNIAREMVRLIQPFGPRRIFAHDPNVAPDDARSLGVELVSLETLLRQSDYVVINCPLTPETRGLLGEEQLAMMKPEAYLINVARGPIVVESALINVLQEGRIRGAALDVFEKEPLPPESPLKRLDNVILTAHCIGWTEELFRDMGRMDCEGVLAVSRGEAPLHVFNPEVLQRPGFRRKLDRYRMRTGT